MRNAALSAIPVEWYGGRGATLVSGSAVQKIIGLLVRIEQVGVDLVVHRKPDIRVDRDDMVLGKAVKRLRIGVFVILPVQVQGQVVPGAIGNIAPHLIAVAIIFRVMLHAKLIRATSLSLAQGQ